MNGWRGARDGIIVSEKLSRELALRLEICQCRLPVLPPREGIWKPKSCRTHLYFGTISGTEILVECFSVTKTEAVVNRDCKGKSPPARNDGSSALVLSVFRGNQKRQVCPPWLCRCFAGVSKDDFYYLVARNFVTSLFSFVLVICYKVEMDVLRSSLLQRGMKVQFVYSL
jgi:hypothetical protein